MLQDHSLLVIGGGSGLGRGVARRCLEQGAALTVFEISPEKVVSLKEEFGEGVLVVQGDGTNSADLLRCRNDLVDRHGKLDAVLSFQGVWDGNVPLKDIAIDRIDTLFDELFHINVKGAFLAARVFHDLLQQSHGAIVLTSSNAAYAADGGGATYSATKGALRSLIQQLAFEFAPHVRVNGVAPGAIGKSELRGPAALGLDSFKQSDIPKDVFLAGYKEVSLIDEFPEAEDYALPYMFLASHANRVMTGQTIIAEQGILNRRFLSKA